MADIEFQKNQCYFAGAIQIASLVLSNHLFDPYFGPSRQQPDALDAGFLLALSTNGYDYQKPRTAIMVSASTIPIYIRVVYWNADLAFTLLGE